MSDRCIASPLVLQLGHYVQNIEGRGLFICFHCPANGPTTTLQTRINQENIIFENKQLKHAALLSPSINITQSVVNLATANFFFFYD